LTPCKKFDPPPYPPYFPLCQQRISLSLLDIGRHTLAGI
jgi:hypothetical protein